MAHRAVLTLPKRVKMCVAENGDPAKRNKMAQELMTFPIVAGPAREDSEYDERDRIEIKLPTSSCTVICS